MEKVGNNSSKQRRKKKKSKPKLRMVDLCAGTGAFSLAFETTGFVDIVFINDIDKSSKIIYDRNFNHELALRDLNDIKIEDIPPHDILTCGFPCFIKGTKVLTNTGIKNIEDVSENDTLLTHTGEFRNILNIQQRTYKSDVYNLKLKYHPTPITATKEHPFYVREMTKSRFGKTYKYIFSNPMWKEVKHLTRNDFVGMVINTLSVIPKFSFGRKVSNGGKVEEVETTLVIDDENKWFMLGYFLGNGWIEETTKKDGRSMNKIRFAISEKNEEFVVSKIQNVLKITLKDIGSKCGKYGCSNLEWFNLLKHFGKYATGKKVPEWVQDAPVKYIQYFLDGYTESDGHKVDRGVEFTTTSENIAYGVQRLYLKLGHIFSVEKTMRPKTTVIEGRIVNQHDTYKIRGKFEKLRNSKAFIEGNYVWFPVKENFCETQGEQIVYNFEVENDNSYCVENCIVHNCQPFSISGKRKGFDDSRTNVLLRLFEIMKYHKPKCVVLENVKNLLTHNEGKSFDIIRTNLEDCGYHISYKVLNTVYITGIPQNRERIYIVGVLSENILDELDFNFPTVGRLEIKEILENEEVNNKYYYDKGTKIHNIVTKEVTNPDTFYQYRRTFVRENKNGVCPTLTHNMGQGGHNVPLILDKRGSRKLTPRECFNLQGFPKNYILPEELSDAKLYGLAGNAVSVPVVKLIADKLVPLIKNS
jgi:DNA (cytosine-5)-methyltransferase 1